MLEVRCETNNQRRDISSWGGPQNRDRWLCSSVITSVAFGTATGRRIINAYSVETSTAISNRFVGTNVKSTAKEGISDTRGGTGRSEWGWERGGGCSLTGGATFEEGSENSV